MTTPGMPSARRESFESRVPARESLPLPSSPVPTRLCRYSQMSNDHAKRFGVSISFNLILKTQNSASLTVLNVPMFSNWLQDLQRIEVLLKEIQCRISR